MWKELYCTLLRSNDDINSVFRDDVAHNLIDSGMVIFPPFRHEYIKIEIMPLRNNEAVGADCSIEETFSSNLIKPCKISKKTASYDTTSSALARRALHYITEQYIAIALFIKIVSICLHSGISIEILLLTLTLLNGNLSGWLW